MSKLTNLYFCTALGSFVHSPTGQICTVYPKKYAHGFVVLCFVVVMQSFIMNSHEVFIHIHQGCFAGTGAIVKLSQCQWSMPDGYGNISQCITTTKHSKAKTVCIFLGIYCISSCFASVPRGQSIGWFNPYWVTYIHQVNNEDTCFKPRVPLFHLYDCLDIANGLTQRPENKSK